GPAAATSRPATDAGNSIRPDIPPRPTGTAPGASAAPGTTQNRGCDRPRGTPPAASPAHPAVAPANRAGARAGPPADAPSAVAYQVPPSRTKSARPGAAPSPAARRARKTRHRDCRGERSSVARRTSPPGDRRANGTASPAAWVRVHIKPRCLPFSLGLSPSGLADAGKELIKLFLAQLRFREV